ncbi:hypothetical protein L7F22_008452 [Adiantum nelumboides]|nr:hypothetical protein [Adiantum nelumboides]
MVDNNEDNFDFAHEGANEETLMLVNYLITWLQHAMANPALQGEVHQQLQAYGFLATHQEERALEKSLGKRGISMAREGENPYQELCNLLIDDTHQSRRRGHAQREESPLKEKERSKSPAESMEEDVAPQRRRAQRSPTPTKRKRSPRSPPHRESKKEEKNSKKKKERKRSPSSLSLSPSSSLDENGGYSSRESPRRGHRRSHATRRRSNKLKKFKEGGKSISFLTYDGAFGATDKVLAFIRQFDVAFGDEGFTESSKLRHVREHDAFILFDPSSNHNFISHELAAKLGIQEFEMEDAMKADGAFIGQDASVTPLIGKLRLHIQEYVDKEYFFISPLKHEDVIQGAPWFDYLAASIKFPEKKISFKFREKDMYIAAQESGSTIPLVNDQAFDKVIKGPIFTFVNKTQANESSMHEDLELSKFLNKFQDVFIDDIPRELPPKRGDDDHAIELILGSSPPNKPPYRVSQAQQEEIMRQINELVEKGMVRPSSSPFCSPVLLVHNKDGTYRMCVNYRALNRITIKNRFFVPQIEDLFDKLQGSTYFSRIDLKSGYHQIRIVNEDILKTAFRTTFGLYEYLVMPFGLTNALATFNRMMEQIFRPYRNFTGVFFDDVIIYSKSIEEHKKHLQIIFQALRDNKLFINQKKSEFFLQEIQYLGPIISQFGIRMDPTKLEVINKWPNSRNLPELKSFIGMCAYYRCFLEKFSLIAGPLHDLTKKNVKYVWTERKQEAFDKLKQKLTSQPVLVLPNLSKPFEVQCDTCGDCLGDVLLQEGRAIAYESHSRLSSDEQVLGIYEKDLLPVLHALHS